MSSRQNDEMLDIFTPYYGELMLIAWHPKRWWNFCMSEDKKEKRKKMITDFYLSNAFNVYSVYSMEVLT